MIVRITPPAHSTHQQVAMMSYPPYLSGNEAGYKRLKAHPFFAGIQWDTIFLTSPPQLEEISAWFPSPNASNAPSISPQVADVFDFGATSPADTAKWDAVLEAGEKIVFSGAITKSHPYMPLQKKRYLMLTSDYRLVYCQPVTMEIKGPYSAERRV